MARLSIASDDHLTLPLLVPKEYRIPSYHPEAVSTYRSYTVPLTHYSLKVCVCVFVCVHACVFMVLGIEPGVSSMLGNCSTTALPQP